MNLIYIVIVYIVYTLVLFTANYYINLFSEKDEYTKDEIKNIFPHIIYCLDRIKSKYIFSMMLLTLTTSSLIGLSIPFISSHWIIQSAITFSLIFFTFPIIKKNFEDARVMSSANLGDNFANIFAKHSDIIMLGFGIGFGSSFMYIWANNKELSFLWFILNITIISLLLEYTLQKIIRD
jgi:hypothetical protein